MLLCRTRCAISGLLLRQPPTARRRLFLSVRAAASDDGSFFTLASRVQADTEVKKSKFIAIASPVRGGADRHGPV